MGKSKLVQRDETGKPLWNSEQTDFLYKHTDSHIVVRRFYNGFYWVVSSYEAIDNRQERKVYLAEKSLLQVNDSLLTNKADSSRIKVENCQFLRSAVMWDLVSHELLKYAKKSITLEEIETWIPSNALSYEQFAQLILSFEDEGILEMVKTKGRNFRTPSLAYTYRIHKQPLKKEFHEQLKQYRLQLHPSINLDPYFGLDPAQWNEDLPYLLLIHDYIESFGLPSYEVPAPERSVELVGDEKWITEKHGKEILERVGLWEAMKIIPVSDPLMFAVNPAVLTNTVQKHLIVENKTTFQALADALPDVDFSTLIYGSGNKIIKSIEQFNRQLLIPQAEHLFYYFGDIDRSGIFIWHRLKEKIPVRLAMPFYQACLKKPSLAGKTNQRIDQVAIEEFLYYFTKQERAQLQSVLDCGHYYPQEVLKTSELQRIWRQAAWN